MKQSNRLRMALMFLAIMLACITAPPLILGKTRTSRIRFARGRANVVMKGAIAKGNDALYLVRARAGQTMTVHISSTLGNAVFDITEPPPGSGTPFVRESKDWSDRTERSGDYYIHVYGLSGDATTYTLEVRVQ